MRDELGAASQIYLCKSATKSSQNPKDLPLRPQLYDLVKKQEIHQQQQTLL